MEKDIRDEELAAMQAEGEEEVICVVLTDEQGNEHEFYQDMVITVDDKQFAVLVPMEDCCCEDEIDRSVSARHGLLLAHLNASEADWTSGR